MLRQLVAQLRQELTQAHRANILSKGLREKLRALIPETRKLREAVKVIPKLREKLRALTPETRKLRAAVKVIPELREKARRRRTDIMAAELRASRRASRLLKEQQEVSLITEKLKSHWGDGDVGGRKPGRPAQKSGSVFVK